MAPRRYSTPLHGRAHGQFDRCTQLHGRAIIRVGDQLFLQQFFFLQQMADMDVAIYINCKRQRSPDAERPVVSGQRTPEKKARMSVRIYINGDEQLAESAFRLLMNWNIASLTTPLDLPTSRSNSALRPPDSARRVASDIAMKLA